MSRTEPGNAPTPTPLRLATGRVTALLGAALPRARVLAALDEASARSGDEVADAGPRPALVVRVGPVPGGEQAAVEALADAAGDRAALVLIDHLTDGLTAAARRRVLGRLPAVAAAGSAVLVDDSDPVAALAVADAALRVGRDGVLAAEQLQAPTLANP